MEWNGNMQFYVQQVDVAKDPQHRVALLDVRNREDALRFEGSFPGGADRQDESQATMFSWTYKPDGVHGLKEGSWYDIPLHLFGNLEYEVMAAEGPGGLYARGALSMVNAAPLNVSGFVSSPQWAKVVSANVPLVKQSSSTEPHKLLVVNCGQGNWNEVGTANHRLIYDAGACRSFNAKQVATLVQSRALFSEKREVSIVISHWDIDHYQALLAFETADFAKVQAVFAPSQLPDTATFQRVQDKLKLNKVPLVTLQPANNATGSREITLHAVNVFGAYRVFRATAGRSRNQTGIVIGVQGPNRAALLTGDHHYKKILACAGPLYANKKMVLVAPHHGGLAGDLEAADWKAKFPDIQTPISVGVNSWGHPLDEYVKKLKSLQGSDVWRTDKLGSFLITL